MSVDLSIKITTPIHLRRLLPDVARILADLLGVKTVPTLTLDVLQGGRRLHAETDELRDRSSHFFLVSIRGERETVGLQTDGEHLNIVMAAMRTPLEYGLGAAVAIAVAREFAGRIQDDGQFFFPSVEATSEEMFNEIRVQSEIPPHSLREAAAELRLRGNYE